MILEDRTLYRDRSCIIWRNGSPLKCVTSITHASTPDTAEEFAAGTKVRIDGRNDSARSANRLFGESGDTKTTTLTTRRVACGC